MKKLLVLLLVGSAVGYLRARQRRSIGASAHGGLGQPATDHPAPAMSSLGDAEGMRGQLAHMGIADVDPEGLAGMGEAIDPDANAEAHRVVRDQRAKLP